MFETYLRFGLKGLLASIGPLSGEVMLAWVGLRVLQDARGNRNGRKRCHNRALKARKQA